MGLATFHLRAGLAVGGTVLGVDEAIGWVTAGELDGEGEVVCDVYGVAEGESYAVGAHLVSGAAVGASDGGHGKSVARENSG